MGGAKEFDIILSGVYLDDNYVGSKKLEESRKWFEKKRHKMIRRIARGRESRVSSHPSKVQHFFHSCPLFHEEKRIFRCGACHKNFYDYSYRCEPCDFDMDVECAQAPQCKEGLFPHFSHRHLLKVVCYDEEILEGENESFCEICGEACDTGPVCVCEECPFYVHEFCMDVLPREIQHLFHDCSAGCPLFLVTKPHTRCKACDKEGSGLCFFCRKCGFMMCVECSLVPTLNSRSDDEIKKKIQHFLHRHTLKLVENLPNVLTETCCSACGKCSPDGHTYVCTKLCNFFLHKSCAELPPEIKSSYHLPHSLFLKNVANNCQIDLQNPRCILCLKDCQYLFAYCCNECNVLLDVECAFQKPTIEYQRHNHLLTVVESLHIHEFKCFACKKSRPGFPVFRCIECNFNLHLLCGPLPLIIKHKCHIHPLMLLDYFVEEDRHDYCCHACENPRDPELCAYRCSDCLFVSDVKCILTEILSVLKGRDGDVKLRTIAKSIPSRLVISQDLPGTEVYKDRSPAYARRYARRRSKSSDNILQYFNIQEVSDCSTDYMDGSLICYLKFRGKTNVRIREDTFTYSNECFNQLIKRLKLNSLLWDSQLQDFVEDHNKFVTFQDYLFPESLIPTLESFLNKYGDLSVNSKARRPNVKSVYFYLLCCVLESMNTTKLLDVTEDQLSNWHACLYKVKNAGFEIKVVYDHLDRVVRAHFGLRAQKFKDDTSDQLKGKIKSVSEEIERLSKELEETKKKLEDHEKFVNSGTTSLIKQCLTDASKMKYIYAASGLL